MDVKLPQSIREALEALGVDPALVESCAGGPQVRVMKASLDDTLEVLRKSNRDQVVMTRVDSETAQALDDWVKVGAAKSRSEAAALFLREGLNMRAADLKRLAGVLAEYEAAKARLKHESDSLFGRANEEDSAID